MKNLKILLLLCSVCYIRAFGQAEFYVSPFGDDSNPGTIEAPFKTIQKAQNAVRQISKKAAGNYMVYLRDGTYRIDKTIQFDHHDSGGENYKSIYQAYKDEKPVVSGGVQITGWEPHKDGIWKASAEGVNFRQLYVNGKRATRSRQPNSGDFFRLKAWDMANKRIVVGSGQISNWNNFEQVEMVVQISWAESILRLKSFELYGPVAGSNDAYVTIQDEERNLLFPRKDPAKSNNQVFHFENAYEFLDVPGEWYLDLSAGLLYYKPRSEENMNYIDVVAPGVETLLKIEGTLDAPVRNLVFRGIGFEHSTWMYPSDHGCLNMQSGQYDVKTESNGDQYVDRPPAGISVAAAQNILFERNVFQHMGATGIDLFYGTKKCQIVGNIITDISGNGIAVGKFVEDKHTVAVGPYNPEDKREICTNDVVSNNIVYQTGRDYYGTHGIVAGYSAGIRIEHNVVRDIPYTGISVGYGWTFEPNAMHDNLVAYNNISDVVNLLCDGGGIYTLSRQPGTKITGNHIYNITRSKWASSSPVAGIYLDMGTSGTKEDPFILQENLIDLHYIKRYNFHITGEVITDNDYQYIDQEGAKEVMEKAGLEPGYKELESIFFNTKKEMTTKELVFMADLKNEKEAIEKYSYYHSAEGVWPEAIHAAKTSGIKKIKIYRFANHLVMIVTIPEDADMEEISRKYIESGNRIKEWDKLMTTFQQAPTGAKEGETFVPMELIHDYENGVVK